MSKSDKGHASKQAQIKRYLFSNTIMNIDTIANQINEGAYADKEMMIKLINRMLAFLNEFVKPKEEIKNGNGISDNGTKAETDSVREPTGTAGSNPNA